MVKIQNKSRRKRESGTVNWESVVIGTTEPHVETIEDIKAKWYAHQSKVVKLNLKKYVSQKV